MLQISPFAWRYVVRCAALVLLPIAVLGIQSAEAGTDAMRQGRWQEPEIPTGGPSSGSSRARQPTSVYARRLEPSAAEPSTRPSTETESESTALPATNGVGEGVSPILAAELDYDPPPPWPNTTQQQSETASRLGDSLHHTASVYDSQLQAATYVAPPASETQSQADGSDRRLLTSGASPKRRQASAANDDEPGDAASLPKFLGLPRGSLVTTLGATSIVAGLFFISMVLLRRGMPKSAAALPDEVVSVLGRKQLGARQVAQLVRVGNKLVLLSVTPDGTKPLTEVTDPQEVDRLLGLCHQANDNSTTAEFQDVLARMSREPTSPGFLGNSSAASYTSDAYVRRPGGGSHA